MGQSSVNFTCGGLSFSAAGEDETWIATQLDKILGAADSLSRVVPKAPAGQKDTGNGSEAFTGTLASHIKAKNGETSQVQRFLATADWLRLRGVDKLNTAVVSKALSDNQQKRLGNPADCLNQNVGKGYCEKSGSDFYITPEGLKTLGHE